MLLITPIGTIQNNDVHGWRTFNGSHPALV